MTSRSVVRLSSALVHSPLSFGGHEAGIASEGEIITIRIVSVKRSPGGSGGSARPIRLTMRGALRGTGCQGRKNGDPTRPRCALPVRASAVRHVAVG